VADVGDVHYVIDFVIKTAEGANQYIVGYIGPKVSDMGIVVYGGTAAIKVNLAGIYGNEVLNLTPKGIE